MIMERTWPNRILVVEDEADSREMLRVILQAQGQEVEDVENGLKALELLAERSYDLILSDLRMPGMGGEELYRRIALDWPHLVARIVFVSSSEPSPAFQEQHGGMPVPLLRKPVSPHSIQQVLAAVVAGA
jgi:CheY-like chemotaxis protein